MCYTEKKGGANKKDAPSTKNGKKHGPREKEVRVELRKGGYHLEKGETFSTDHLYSPKTPEVKLGLTKLVRGDGTTYWLPVYENVFPPVRS